MHKQYEKNNSKKPHTLNRNNNKSLYLYFRLFQPVLNEARFHIIKHREWWRDNEKQQKYLLFTKRLGPSMPQTSELQVFHKYFNWNSYERGG